MNDKSTTALSRQLHDAAELAPAEPGFTIADVRRLGRRRVRARRAMTAGAGVAVVVMLVVGASATGGWVPGPDQTRGGSVTAAAAPAPPPSSPSASALTPWPASDGTETPLGRLITTSTPYENGILTLWFGRSTDGKSRLQLSLGSSNTSGELRPYGTAVRLDGDDLTPGFGPGYDAISQKPRAYALFGYIVGDDVAKVTLDVDGKPRTGQVAAWSEDPRVHAWWILGPELDEWPAKSVPARGNVSDLTAYDTDGKVVARSPKGEEIARG